MDNRLFNVNGKGTPLLKQTLQLVFAQSGHSCDGWYFTKKSGLILTWSYDDPSKKLTETVSSGAFPVNLTAEDVTPFVEKWLATDLAKTIEYSEWCENSQHDGSNDEGWQVYVEGWGHVGVAGWRAICGIKHAYMWYGK